MISYSTEFPINQDSSVDEVLQLACTWLSGSPYTKIPKESLADLISNAEGSLSIGGERVQSGSAHTSTYQIGGLRYSKLENDHIEWVTTIVASKTSAQHLVSIQVSCEALKTASTLPHPQKPYFVKQILKTIGGGSDGQIPVSTQALFLSEGEEHIAADLIQGVGANNLPIIYVSVEFDGHHIIDPQFLATKLCGMGHVVVEPSRKFSLNLKKLVSSRNAFGGAIGIYWPDSTARKNYYLSEKNDTPEKLQKEISKDVRVALANRRQNPDCTWIHLKECISYNRYESLKNSGSTELDDFIKAFDDDMLAKEQKLMEAEREIVRLKAELKTNSLSHSGRGGDAGVLLYGEEQDLYENEIKGIAIEALRNMRDRTIEHSRRQHVIDDLLKVNTTQTAADEISQQLKKTLHAYTDMDAKTRTSLTKLGFSISEDGKHHKMIFRGDDRYSFTVSKTVSDHRSGKNLTSDINKKLF